MNSIENTIEQVRRINERHQHMYTASAKLAAIHVPTVAVPPRLFESVNSAKTLATQFATIKMPTMPVQPKLFESVNSAKALATHFAAIKLPTLPVQPKLFESVNSAKALATHFAAIKLPTLPVQPKLFESVTVANAMAKQFATIKMPTMPVQPKLFDSVNSSNALAKHFAAINVPTLKQNRNFSESLKFAKPTTQYKASDREIRPILLSHRSIELVPEAASNRSTIRKPSPAEDVVTRIYKEFKNRLALEADRRHDVILVATLLTGKRLLVESIATNGDHLIRVVGNANGEQRTEVVSGFATLQFEIMTIERRPDLKIVH